MDGNVWREWAREAPDWAFQFFAGSDSLDVGPLTDLASRHAHVHQLPDILEELREAESKITIIIEPQE